MSNLLSIARDLLMKGQFSLERAVVDALLALVNEKLGYAPIHAASKPITALPPLTAKPKIALCLGHARYVDQGNIGAGGISEEQYNLPLLLRVAELLEDRGIEIQTFTLYPCYGYEDAMTWLASELVKHECTGAVEFHFNAYDGKAHGHEVLHWDRSKRGISLARCINDQLTAEFPDHTDRGLKPKTYRDRGALFLSLTHCPAAIVESFFGDNPDEWEFFSAPENVEHLAQAISRGIARWVETMEVAA